MIFIWGSVLGCKGTLLSAFILVCRYVSFTENIF